MAEQVDSETPPKCIKKRSRNPAEWKREKRKRLRIAGKEYINTRGELISGRKIGEDCRCRRKCYTNVSEDVRKKLFEGYYSLNSHDEQNAYLFGLIRKKDIARKRSKDSVRRTCTYTYYVRNRGKEIQVCRLAFAHIHGISSPKIRNLCLKLDMNVMFPRDGRGKHDHRPKKITDETIEQIRQHVYSIIKTDKVKDFMKEEKNGPDVNITKMWKDYLKKYEPNIDVVSAKHQRSKRRIESMDHHTMDSQDLPHQPNNHDFKPTKNNTSHTVIQHGEVYVSRDNFVRHGCHNGPIILSNGCCNDGITSSQDSSIEETGENETHSDDDSGEDEQNKQTLKPSVKHWLYSKVFHEELKFHDFLSLRKKLWDLKGEKSNPGDAFSRIGSKTTVPKAPKSRFINDFETKSERKQKIPKKLVHSKEESEMLRTERALGQDNNHGSSIMASSLSHHGLSTSDMYIVPLQFQDMSSIPPQRIQHHTSGTTMDVQPHLSHHSHQHHASMQLNLHSFPSGVSTQQTHSSSLHSLSPVGHQQSSGQLQCVTQNAMPSMNITNAPCNYISSNTLFYQC